MPEQRKRQLFSTITGLLVLCFASDVAVAESDCDEVEVNGGVYSGVYSLHDDDFWTDGDVYHTETDDGTHAFLYYIDQSRRRLNVARQDLEESVHETDEAQHKHFPLGGFGFSPAALENARAHAGETLAACSDGFWVNLEYANDDLGLDDPELIIFPAFVSYDCADHPADITAEWLELACSDCDVTTASVTISCHDSSGEEDDGSVTTTEEDDNDDDGDFSFPIEAIIGIAVAGALLGIGAIVAVCWLVLKGRGSTAHPPRSEPQGPVVASNVPVPQAVPYQPSAPAIANANTATQQPPSYNEFAFWRAGGTDTRPPPFNPATNNI